MLPIVAGHGSEQIQRLRGQVMSREGVASCLRPEPGARRTSKLSNTIGSRHALVAQKQFQKRIHRRPHNPAQHVEPQEPTEGQQGQE